MVLFIFLISALCFAIFPDGVQSEIIIHDMVAPTGKEVMLKAEVKGKVFSKGGALVEFFVNGKPIGKNLSGGDGLAFKQFVPSETGMYQTKARAGRGGVGSQRALPRRLLASGFRFRYPELAPALDALLARPT